MNALQELTAWAIGLTLMALPVAIMAAPWALIAWVFYRVIVGAIHGARRSIQARKER